MEWESWVWRLSGNRRVRKSALATLGLLLIWTMAWRPMVEWRQRMILERMQPIITENVDTGPAEPLDTPGKNPAP
jgi:hypothetical protein